MLPAGRPEVVHLVHQEWNRVAAPRYSGIDDAPTSSRHIDDPPPPIQGVAVRAIARRLYEIPVLGYFARLAAGLIRLPDRLESYDSQLASLSEAARQAAQAAPEIHRHSAALGEMRASLAGEVATATHLAADARDQAAAVRASFDQHLPAFLNVVSSSQAALRLLRREQETLRGEIAHVARELQEHSELVGQQVGKMHAALQGVRGDLEKRLFAIEAANATFNELVSRAESSFVGRLAVAEATLANESRRIETLASRLDQHLMSRETAGPRALPSPDVLAPLQDSVSYLLGRVEFVRREVLFELRYGKGPEDGSATRSRIADGDRVRRIRAEGLRLNVGCGQLPLPDYVNVDLRELPGVDVVAEATDLPFGPGEALEIRSSHLLEHFPREQLLRQVLPHWRAILKPGGLLRSITPDAEAMIAAYGQGAFPYEDLREVTFGSQDYAGDFHYNMFTPESLCRTLSEAGFASPEVIDRGRRNGRCFELEVLARAPSA